MYLHIYKSFDYSHKYKLSEKTLEYTKFFKIFCIKFFMITRIFKDDRRIVRVEQVASEAKIFYYAAADIFPALHFVESHPDFYRIEGERVSEPIVPKENEEIEVFQPVLIPDSVGHTYGYQNYNFILLNADIQHPFNSLIEEFAKFIYSLRNKKPRKLKIKDFQPEYVSPLLRGIQMKGRNDEHEFHYSIERRNGSEKPDAIYLHAQHLSPGLSLRLGIHDSRVKLSDSDLEARLSL